MSKIILSLRDVFNKTAKTKLNFSKKRWKTFLWVLILLWLWTVFFSHNMVYAQSNNTVWEWDQTIEKTQNDMLADINELLENWLKLIYALLWPVLFIAGIALDNTLVYGSFLHLDASLWSLRNIMKNFANFALWFLVLFAIVKNLFTAPFGGWWDSKNWSPINIIKKTLIAGVLIQMSWFLMAAVIDVSTILTYSIGGLPMTVMENNPDTKNRPILWLNASLDMNWTSKKGTSELNYYNTYWDKNISLCRTEEVPGLTWKYIIARSKVKVKDDVFFEKGICTLWARPYGYKEIEWENFSDATENNIYKENLSTYLKNLGTGAEAKTVAESLKSACHIIAINPSNGDPNCTSEKGFGSLKNNSEFFTSIEWLTIDSLLEKSKGFVGPFITIYSSLLDYSSIADSPSSTNSILTNFFIFLVKFLFAAALFFPLLALTVVLIARVWILWLAIVALPIIVLLNVFKDALGTKFDGMMETFKISNLVGLIFAPVFVVFAISMSMIFLEALDTNHAQNEIKKDISRQQLEELWISTNDNKTYSILGLVNITLDWAEVSDWLDTFSWLITNLFAVWIIWFFLFAAVKMTKIWKSVWWWIQKSVQGLVGNMPIIPIAWGIWVSAASQWMKDLKNQFSGKNNPAYKAQMKELQKAMPWLYGESISEWGDTSTATKENAWTNYNKANTIYAAAIAAGNTNMTMDKAFSEAWVTSAQKDIITAANPNYISEFNNYSTVLWWESTEEKNITTFDASKYDSWTITNMVNNWGAWQEWAKWVVWGNVKTNGDTMVMVNAWTYANPDFKLVSQDSYATDYLWQSSDWKYDEVVSDKKIRDKIEKQYGDLEKLTENDKLNMEKHIKMQQKELIDRLKQIEDKDKNSTTLISLTTWETWGKVSPAE